MLPFTFDYRGLIPKLLVQWFTETAVIFIAPVHTTASFRVCVCMVGVCMYMCNVPPRWCSHAITSMGWWQWSSGVSLPWAAGKLYIYLYCSGNIHCSGNGWALADIGGQWHSALGTRWWAPGDTGHWQAPEATRRQWQTAAGTGRGPAIPTGHHWAVDTRHPSWTLGILTGHPCQAIGHYCWTPSTKHY